MDEILRAARRGDFSATLSLLLARWRETRDAELAMLIERVSPAARAAPIAEAGSASKEAKKRIATATDADVGPILDFVLRLSRTFPRATELVAELAHSRPADPRIASAIVQLIRSPPSVDFRLNEQGALQSDLVRALHAIDDPRYDALVVAEWERLEPRRGLIRKLRPKLDVLKEVALAIREKPARTPDGEAHVIALAVDEALASATDQARARSRSAEDLLAAIYDDPADTALRIVYADVLQSQGDPRGELIALQCNRAEGDAPSKRERQLERAHGRTWLGAIEPIVKKSGLVYRRGFPSALREGLHHTTDAPLLEAREWSTVEELDCGACGEAFLANPRWKVLRRVHGIHGSWLPGLAERRATLPWVLLNVRYPRLAHWPIVEALLPDLKELDLAQETGALPYVQDFLGQLGAIRTLGIASRLCRLRISTSRVPLEPLLAATLELGVGHVELVPDHFFPPEPVGPVLSLASGALTITHHGKVPDFRYAIEILGALPSGFIRTAEFAGTGATSFTSATWTALDRACERHGFEVPRPSPT